MLHSVCTASFGGPPAARLPIVMIDTNVPLASTLAEMPHLGLYHSSTDQHVQGAVGLVSQHLTVKYGLFPLTAPNAQTFYTAVRSLAFQAGVPLQAIYPDASPWDDVGLVVRGGRSWPVDVPGQQYHRCVVLEVDAHATSCVARLRALLSKVIHTSTSHEDGSQ